MIDKIKVGKSLTLDLLKLDKKSPDLAYDRLRQQVSRHSRKTGQEIFTRKTGNIVKVYRVK